MTLLAAFTWTEFAQQMAAGVREGAIYAGLALAIVIIYRSTRVINFAQGEMATFTTFIAWSLMNRGLSFWVAFPIVLAIAFAGGVTIERILIRPVEDAPVLTVVIVTLGLFFLVNGAARWFWSSETRSLPNAFSTRPIDVAGVAFSIQDLGNIGVSLAVVVLLWGLFQFRLALRASAVNPESSRLAGVRVGWMLALGWGIAAVLGAVAGMMIAPVVFLDPNMMQTILLYAFAAAVLGGLDSPAGAVVGGILLGVTITLLGRYVGFIGSTLKLPVALLLILILLLVRPGGLFGRVAVRRV
ncbi:MAG: branched-chain amino acid ABC transporter permease [Actinobacteria bacterium]|nr:MAG: branched-chain amino acid ABC transporter permease [Actinomycetota bacterium]